MSGHVQYLLNKSITKRSIAIQFLWKNIFLKMCLFKKRHIKMPNKLLKVA